MTARGCLSGACLERVIDYGPGATARDFNKFRVTVFDRDYPSSTHFAGVTDRSEAARNITPPAYQRPLARTPEVGCGMAELAGASVAVAFVSAFVATLALAQAIRIASGQTHVLPIIGSIDSLAALGVSEAPDTAPSAIGYAEACT